MTGLLALLLIGLTWVGWCLWVWGVWVMVETITPQLARADVLSVQCAPAPLTLTGQAGCAEAITPIVTAAAANNLVLKASAANVFSVTAANQTATAGFLVLL